MPGEPNPRAPVIFKPIGTIHTPWKEPKGTPIQSALPEARDVEATVEVFPDYAAGLKDLDGFSHIMLLYFFHRAHGPSLIVTPFLDNEPRGVFSTRAPTRPNPIGISVVRLVSMRPEGFLLVRGIDILDGTPLLDIKPYIPAFDTTAADRTGWFGLKARL
jgi:tRNA (adenine37-N6)-methyltransferase